MVPVAITTSASSPPVGGGRGRAAPVESHSPFCDKLPARCHGRLQEGSPRFRRRRPPAPVADPVSSGEGCFEQVMSGLEARLRDSLRCRIPAGGEAAPDAAVVVAGGLFLEPAVPPGLLSSVSFRRSSGPAPRLCCSNGRAVIWGLRTGGGFLSVSLSIKEGERFVRESTVGLLEPNGEKVVSSEEASEEKHQIREMGEEKKKVVVQGAGAGAMNTTKHLWAGAVSAMVSR